MKYLYYLLLLIFVSCDKKAERDAELDKFNSVFFEKYKSNTLDAMNFMYSSNKNFENNKAAIDSLNIKLVNLIKQLGEYKGSEFITERKVGESLILRSYLVKYDLQPIRFTFMYYKPKDRWILYYFYFDSSVEEELKSSAQLQFMNETYSETELE